MRKIILLLLCCGVLIGMVGCGGNTAPPSTESLSSIALEITMTETPHTTAVEPTEKEKETVYIESQEQASDPTSTATVKSTEETKTTVTNTSEEKGASQVVETASIKRSQHTEIETTTIEPTKETAPEPDTSQSEFDIQYWISFAKEYAISIGLSLDSAAIDCWDNPIGANSQCIYLERDIKNRLNRYAKDKDITDVWIWTETIGNSCYDIYIGYA